MACPSSCRKTVLQGAYKLPHVHAEVLQTFASASFISAAIVPVPQCASLIVTELLSQDCNGWAMIYDSKAGFVICHPAQ